MKTTTISVGIPAYNEGGNIKHLLTSLLAQTGDNFLLDTIYIVSDGSNDDTTQQVQSLKDKRIILKDDRKRLGKSARLEEILRLNKADVLLLLDADIVFDDIHLFEKLLKHVDFKKTGIASINALPSQPTTFFERTLDAGVYTAKRMAEQWNNGDNYLSFKGCFLALSKDFVTQIHMPEKLINNDAYLYFSAKQKGFKATYVKECIVYYHSPKTLADHIKQSSRFQYSQAELETYFKNLGDLYNTPKDIYLKSMLQSLVAKHIFFVSYLLTNVISKMRRQSVNSTWSIAGSTKRKLALSN